MGWTEERVALLTKLWADGLSASQIAAELGGVSRNAVIGKRIRLGLPDRGPTRNRVTRTAKKPKPPRRYQFGNGVDNRPPPEPFKPAPPIEAPPAQRKTILVRDSKGQLCANDALTSVVWRFPYGEGTKDDPFYFCGGQALEGLPYCAAHAAVAFQPPQPRR